MAPMVYSGAREKPIHEKNLKSKISCQTLFRMLLAYEIELEEKFSFT
jgi:hypothetical protein